MLTYWLMFLFPALVTMSRTSLAAPPCHHWRASWFYVWLTLTLLVGWRHEVGGDWIPYLDIFENTIDRPLAEVFENSKELGYMLLNWVGVYLELDVHFVNLCCGAIFAAGLVAFCRNQPRPWLSLAVAMPYLVIVIGMGYTRQAVALGFAMLGLVSLSRQRTLHFVLWVAMATLFHKSAVLLIPLAVMATPRGKLWSLVWVGISTGVLYWLVLADSVDTLKEGYLEAAMQSEGAFIRVAMNLLPALLLLVFRRRFVWTLGERNLWVQFALLAIVTFIWLFLSSSSTAVDRVALYLIPLQIYVFSRLPDIISKGRARRFWVNAVLVYYTTVQFVWLFFGVHAEYWLPYDNVLFPSF